MLLRRSLAAPLLALVLAAPDAAAQRREEAPRRPALAATADPNDTRSYYSLGVSLLPRRPDEAAAAFYWAVELEPRSADALYGRHAALLMADPRRILDYHGLTYRARDRADMVRIDSLYYRALMLDPFVQRRFEREVLRMLIASYLSGGDPRGVQDQSLLQYETSRVMQQLSPLTRARLHAAEGRMGEAMREYDLAMRENRRRQETRRWMHHERGRVYALAGNDSAALRELQAAIDAEVEREQRDLVRVYSSKALLEHSRGMLFERRGDAGRAREAYARALTEDLAYHPAHARLGVLALAGGDTATALAELALAAEAAPGDPVARFVHGSLLVHVADWERAEAELAAATALAPHFAEAWVLLGAARQQRGDTGGAVAAYTTYVERARRDDPRRARIAAALGQPEGS